MGNDNDADQAATTATTNTAFLMLEDRSKVYYYH